MHMHFSGDLVLLTHMLMSGSWHIYRPGEPWRMSRYHMRIVVATERMVAVAFHVQVAEFHTEASLARRPGFSRLGPDILADDFDAGAVVANLAGRPDLDAGVALMTQSLLAGVGNVYKSESCFLAGVNPFRKVAELTSGELQTLVAVARKLMRANIAEGAFRRTTGRSDPAERLWVYHRGGEPCRRCGTVILSQKQGIDARVTFWCPQCQH
jgi:endonuclease-8